MLFSTCLFRMPETAFSGAQIAPKSLSGASPQTHCGSLQRSPRLPSWIQGALLLRLLLLRGREARGGEGRGGEDPEKIVHHEKLLRIGPAPYRAFATPSPHFPPCGNHRRERHSALWFGVGFRVIELMFYGYLAHPVLLLFIFLTISDRPEHLPVRSSRNSQLCQNYGCR